MEQNIASMKWTQLQQNPIHKKWCSSSKAKWWKAMKMRKKWIRDLQRIHTWGCSSDPLKASSLKAFFSQLVPTPFSLPNSLSFSSKKTPCFFFPSKPLPILLLTVLKKCYHPHPPPWQGGSVVFATCLNSLLTLGSRPPLLNKMPSSSWSK